MLSVNTVILQAIAHMDIDGCTTNLLDMLIELGPSLQRLRKKSV